MSSPARAAGLWQVISARFERETGRRPQGLAARAWKRWLDDELERGQRPAELFPSETAWLETEAIASGEGWVSLYKVGEGPELKLTAKARRRLREKMRTS